jgi:hypothetical protein
LRIHWLIRKLTFERCDLHERSKIFVNACKQAQVGWLVDFTTSAIGDYYPREGQEPEPPEKCLVEKDQVSVLRTIATEKINEAAANGSLIKHPQLAYILYRWRDKFCDGDDIVKAWTKLQLSDDVAVALFARAFTGESWSQGMGMFGPGDHVAVRHTKAAVKSLELLMDVDQFRRRLDELEKAKTLPKPYQAYVEVLLEAWRRRDRGEDRDW